MTRFFGYGSLVNARTHEYERPQPASLAGWRRTWCCTRLRPIAFLSVRACANSTIDGLIADVPGGDWRALDAREAAYRRHQIADLPPGSANSAQIYQVDPAHHVPGGAPRILLSYLDVVVQGYLDMFGRAGVTRFFDTTDGWHGVLVNDRAAPIYPRHQTLSPEETALVDAFTGDLAMTVEELE